MEKSLDDDKAEDVIVIPLVGKTDIADFMVVATGTSQRHIATLAQHLRERIKPGLARDVLIEGEGPRDWVLVDAGDVIVHLFRAETRAFYALEKLWTDAPARPPRESGDRGAASNKARGDLPARVRAI